MLKNAKFPIFCLQCVFLLLVHVHESLACLIRLGAKKLAIVFNNKVLPPSHCLHWDSNKWSFQTLHYTRLYGSSAWACLQGKYAAFYKSWEQASRPPPQCQGLFSMLPRHAVMYCGLECWAVVGSNS